MGSLRTKLTLALLAMSFIAVAVVGMTARWIVLRRFDDLVVERAFQGFTGEIVDYYEAYGSWEAAREAESFFDFVRRTRPGVMRPDSRTVETGRRAAGPRGRPGPRPGGPSGEDQSESSSSRRFGLGGDPPAFLVVDPAGTVLLDLAGRRMGEVLSPREMTRARPILSGGTEIALAVPLERPVLSQLEERYFSAIQESWLYALLVAVVLAVPVGIVLGNRFAGPIRELTVAIRAMQGGELRQSVAVRSNGELGELLTAFNHMSEDLAGAHHELETSRARLGEQAALLEELSRRDDLTQLSNRRAFDERVRTLFAQASRYDHSLTLAMVDVDRFKRVNDEFSHATGDAVLREVAVLIGGHIRDSDVVARYGGEEFAIAFPETALADAARLAERLRELVEDHDWAGIASGLSVTLSVGLSERSTSASFQEVLEAADSKLYEAKGNGRNQVCF